MRRDVKFVVLILVLIVAPAVILSFLAARVLENWEVILRDRMAGDAQRVLTATAESWNHRMQGLQDAVRNRLLARVADPTVPPDFPAVVSVVAEIRSEFPWILGVDVIRDNGEILYPVALRQQDLSASSESAGGPLALLAQADQRRLQPDDATEGMAEYRRMIASVDLDPVVRSLTLLRLGDREAASGQADAAAQRFMACADLAWRNGVYLPIREPEEGFLPDLVALGRLAGLYAAANRPDAVEKTLARIRLQAGGVFDSIPAAQRARVVALMQDAGRKSSDLRWEECVRAHAMAGADRRQSGRELSAFLESLGQESGLQWIRKGGGDYLVCAPAKGRTPPTLAILQVDAAQLAKAVAQSAGPSAQPIGLRLDCLPAGMDSPGGREGTVLLERRLAAPLDRLTLAAAPADPQALAANVRLKKNLYGAGGLLLLAGVMAGAWILWRETVMELRMAREHSEFAAAVSHDLRTPLSSMRMLAESLYLDRVQDPQKRAKFLETILKESDRLSRLTDRALYFIRHGEGALRYRFTEGDLGTVVRSAVVTFATGIGADVVPVEGEAALAQDAGAGDNRWRIRLWIQPGLDMVRFDAGALEQVVFNLLDNAVKYSGREHAIEVEVKRGPAASSGRARWFRAGRHRGTVELAIRDHGAGMSPEEVGRIARPYMRGRTAAETHARGIGLGLALCRHVAHAHKGQLLIRSREGEGSIFRVLLPAG